MLVYVNVTKVANTNTTLPLLPPPQPVAKKLVNATGAENYNILQNNGRIAHQEVDHVSHSVPSPLPALLLHSLFVTNSRREGRGSYLLLSCTDESQVHFHMVSQTKPNNQRG